MSTHLRDMNWYTNNSEVADQLRAADKTYLAARAAAKPLQLEKKIEALREANRIHEEAYAAIRQGLGDKAFEAGSAA